MLQIATGAGWKQFMHMEADTSPLHTRPMITVAVDQGGDGWSGLHYLQSKRARLTMVNDTSHRVWNDTQLGLQDCRLYTQCLLTTIAMNLDHGPWAGARWWEEIKQSAKDYTRLGSPQCPIFKSLLPQIMKERALLDPHDDMSPESIFESLKEVVEHKFQKVGMTRWFQFCHASKKLTGIWTSRLCLLLYMSLTLGLFKRGRLEDFVSIAHAQPGPDADIEKATTAEDQERVRNIRKSCRNTVQFVTMIFADKTMWRINVMVSAATAPIAEWHSAQNKRNRSADESLKWWQAQAVDRGQSHVNDILQVLGDAHLWETVGGIAMANFTQSELLRAKPDDPVVEQQDELAQSLGKLVVCLAMRRMRTMSCFSMWPSRFAALLDDTQADIVLDEMRAYAANIEKAKNMPGAFWKKLRERSPLLNNQVVKDIFDMLEQEAWVLTPVIKQRIASIWKGVTETKLIEDGIRDERVGEVSKGFNKITGGQRAWVQLVRAGTDHEKHRYCQMDWPSVVVPRGMKDRPVAGLFRPQKHRIPKEFKEVVSFANKAPYFSTAPLLQPAPAEDAALMRHCQEHDCWRQGPNSWLGSLALATDGLLIRHPLCHDGRWCLSLGSVLGTALSVLPLEEVRVKRVTMYKIAKFEGHCFTPVLELDTVEAMTFAWRRTCLKMKFMLPKSAAPHQAHDTTPLAGHTPAHNTTVTIY